MRIRWTLPASGDLTEICDYLEKHGSAAIARRVAIFIYESISKLGDFPELGRTGRISSTRELVITGLPYVAVYRIHNNSVEILRVLHGAQDWP